MKLPGETAIKAIAAVVVVLVIAFVLYRCQSSIETGAEAKVELRHSEGRVAGEVAGRAAEQASTTTSEAIADSTRASAALEVAANTKTTEASVAKIERIYVQTPALATPCRDDGGPAPMPAGVLEELDQARATLIEAAAAPG